MKKVFFIVGPARSGTTFLASLLEDSKLIYFEEPNSIWKYKNVNFDSDVLSSDDVSHKKSAFIRKYFISKAEKAGVDIVLEKTPSNCFRLDYVKAVFPEAKYIFVERNLGEIATSARKKWLYEVDPNTKRLFGDDRSHKKRQLVLMIKRFMDIPLVDMPLYLGKVFSELSFSLFGRKRKVWGPRYDGILSDVENLSEYEVCYKQAKLSYEAIYKFIKSLPAEDYVVVEYDEMTRDPDRVSSLVKKFMCI